MGFTGREYADRRVHDLLGLPRLGVVEDTVRLE